MTVCLSVPKDILVASGKQLFGWVNNESTKLIKSNLAFFYCSALFEFWNLLSSLKVNAKKTCLEHYFISSILILIFNLLWSSVFELFNWFVAQITYNSIFTRIFLILHTKQYFILLQNDAKPEKNYNFNFFFSLALRRKLTSGVVAKRRSFSALS